jgi:hypothetical protein
MVKILLVCLLFYSIPALSQIRNDKFDNLNIYKDSINRGNKSFKASYAISFSSGIFLPIKLDNEDNNGMVFNLGVQKVVSESIMLILDIDYAFTKRTNKFYYDFYNLKYYERTYWNSYLQFQFGYAHILINSKKLRLFIGPETGFSFSKYRGKNWEINSFPPFFISILSGLEYKIDNKLFLSLKIKHNSKVVSSYSTLQLNNYLFIKGGISYQF